MSSLRNAIQRRNHKERSQPLERQKWGLLEKRKDYKLRAADHKTKTRKISALKAKASERNEDEFYFGMVNGVTKGGVKVARKGEENGGGKALGDEVVRLMKTQDVGYLRTMLQRCRRERGRVEEGLVGAEVGVPKEERGGKVVFGEDGESLAVKAPGEEVDEDMDFDMDFDESAEDEDEDSSDDENLTPEEKLAKSRKKHALDVKRRKLEALKEQEEKLSAALEALEHQRAKMNHTIGGTNKAGVKFKTRERKR